MKLRRRSISVEDDLWAKVMAMATAHDRSTSQYVRLVLRDHIKSLGIKLKDEK
jgi:Arc/MetJ family transcription regulator